MGTSLSKNPQPFSCETLPDGSELAVFDAGKGGFNAFEVKDIVKQVMNECSGVKPTVLKIINSRPEEVHVIELVRLPNQFERVIIDKSCCTITRVNANFLAYSVNLRVVFFGSGFRGVKKVGSRLLTQCHKLSSVVCEARNHSEVLEKALAECVLPGVLRQVVPARHTHPPTTPAAVSAAAERADRMAATAGRKPPPSLPPQIPPTSAPKGERDSDERDTENSTAVAPTTSSDKACVVCLSAAPECVFLPCRHLVVCKECSAQHFQKKNSSSDAVKCPVCRGEVKDILEVFT